jgi:hypothetical protein
MNFSGLQSLLTGTVLVLILVVVGVVIVARSGKGDHRGVMATLGVVLAGLLVIGIAVSGKAPGVASWLAGLV